MLKGIGIESTCLSVIMSYKEELLSDQTIERHTKLKRNILYAFAYEGIFNVNSNLNRFLALQLVNTKPSQYMTLMNLKSADSKKGILVLGINEKSLLLNRLRVNALKDLLYRFIENLNLSTIPSERRTYDQTVSVLSVLGTKLRDPEKYGLITKDEFNYVNSTLVS
ncbi:MAG: hypothetical protein WCK31_02310 [bacterium]